MTYTERPISQLSQRRETVGLHLIAMLETMRAVRLKNIMPKCFKHIDAVEFFKVEAIEDKIHPYKTCSPGHQWLPLDLEVPKVD